MDTIRQTIRAMVREALAAELAAMLGSAEPTKLTNDDSDDEPIVSTRRRAIGPRVVYGLTKAGKKTNAGDSLASNNAKVFRFIAKHDGRTKAQIAAGTSIPPHSCESNINQLQQMGLIASRPID